MTTPIKECWGKQLKKTHLVRIVEAKKKGKILAKKVFEYMMKEKITTFRTYFGKFSPEFLHPLFSGEEKKIVDILDFLFEDLIDSFIQELYDNCLVVRIGDEKIQDGNYFISKLEDDYKDDIIISIDCHCDLNC